jgi:hypothetical protein
MHAPLQAPGKTAMQASVCNYHAHLQQHTCKQPQPHTSVTHACRLLQPSGSAASLQLAVPICNRDGSMRAQLLLCVGKDPEAPIDMPPASGCWTDASRAP